MESFLDKIKKDVKKGFNEGVAAVMQGASVVSVKINELSTEGKRQYKIFDMTVKIRDHVNDLGDIAYDALNTGKSLDENKKIKAAFLKIKKLEWQLRKMEGGPKVKSAAAKKPAKKAKAASKKSGLSAAK
jgi:hypothetical protein